MSESLILHHYDRSPYAEKIRLMFGLKGMRWHSVLSPAQPPRPNVDPLSGGYRRIPVAQIGADIFCDTFIIAKEVARLADAPELDPETVSEDAAEIMRTAQGDAFFAAIGAVSPLSLLWNLLSGFGLAGTLRFVSDRVGMMQGATVKAPQGAQARSILANFLAALDRHLADREFVSGACPSVADFSAYHPLWLHLSAGGSPLDARYANVRRWFDRVAAFGQGERVETSPEQAFEAAKSADPRPLPETERAADVDIGRSVSIAPSDYGTVPVTGTLVAVTASRWIVARDTERFGTLHVHFPRKGYSITPA